MSLIGRSTYDHPEHFDDTIREYRTSERYRPTALEDQLLELSGHRCMICRAPWCEIHHIVPLNDGGLTEFDNLAVLCPNCHTRVHAEGVPSRKQLRHYKLKQEIAYELPILSRLGGTEIQFLRAAAETPPDELPSFASSFHFEVLVTSHEEAKRLARIQTGLMALESQGIVRSEVGFTVTLGNSGIVAVPLDVRLTGKGIRWLRYVVDTGRLRALGEAVGEDARVAQAGS